MWTSETRGIFEDAESRRGIRPGKHGAHLFRRAPITSMDATPGGLPKLAEQIEKLHQGYLAAALIKVNAQS